MTQYKKLLLDYLIGTLNKEEPKNEHIFEKQEEIDINQWKEFIPDGRHINGYISMPDEINDITVLYGQTNRADTSNYNGWILLLDESFNPIKLFEKTKDGNLLKRISCMYADTEGNIYAVEDISDTGYSQQRFVYFNNFTNKINNDYSLEILKTYTIPYADSDNLFYCRNILKDPNSSKFILYGDRVIFKPSSSVLLEQGISIIYLNVNVGESNDWKIWKYVDNIGNFNNLDNLSNDIYVEWLNNELIFHIIVLKYGTYGVNKLNPYLVELTNQDDLVVSRKICDIKSVSNIPNMGLKSIQYIDKDTFYISLSNAFNVIRENSNVGIYKIKNNNLTILYENEYLASETTEKSETVSLLKDSINQVYAFSYINDRIISKTDLLFAKIDEDKIQWEKIIQQQKLADIPTTYIVSRKFNIINYLLLSSSISKIYKLQEIDSINNYNGIPYENLNSFIPLYSNLYSNNNLVFSRNIYNLTIQGNSTISSVEVPKNYLNNRIINPSKLISQTKTEIVNNTKNIEKNIYEAVNINFINSVLISNENDSKSVIINKESSNLLNKAINNIESYDNSKMTKAKINYKDGTTKIISYELKDVQDTSVTLFLGLYIDKEMNSLQFISEDENIVYQTIDLTNLEIDKTYSISQRLEVV